MLPKCVRVDAEDEQSAASLVSDGWHYVGTLVTYMRPLFVSARLSGADWPVIGTRVVDRHSAHKPATRDALAALAEKIEWSGRLFRDDKIDRTVAVDALVSGVRERANNAVIYGDYEAFGLFRVCGRALRVDLIGVAPQFVGGGRAKAVIETAASRWPLDCLVAGTYQDNYPSKRLYESLGMHVVKREETFHK